MQSPPWVDFPRWRPSSNWTLGGVAAAIPESMDVANRRQGWGAVIGPQAESADVILPRTRTLGLTHLVADGKVRWGAFKTESAFEVGA